MEVTGTTEMDKSSKKYTVEKVMHCKHRKKDDDLAEEIRMNSSPGLSSLLAYLDETEQKSQNIFSHSLLSKGDKHCEQTVMEVKTSIVRPDVSIKCEKQDRKTFIWDNWEDKNISTLPVYHEDKISRLSSRDDALRVKIKMDHFNSIDKTAISLHHSEKGISHKPVDQSRYSEFYSEKCEEIKERAKSMREELLERIKEEIILQTKFTRTKVANQHKISRFNGIWTSKIKDKEMIFEKVSNQRIVLCCLIMTKLSEPNKRVLLQNH